MVDCNRFARLTTSCHSIKVCKGLALRRSLQWDVSLWQAASDRTSARIWFKIALRCPPTSDFWEGMIMSTGWNFKKLFGRIVLCAAIACLGIVGVANADAVHGQRKAKKPTPPPPLPSGPTGPVQALPLDSIAPVAPQVSYQNAQLTIVAPNSTLGDILRAVRKQTGAEIDVPSAPERVVTHLGPGPAREVLAELLNGSRFNYVLLGSPADDAQLTRVVLVAKSANETVGPANNASPQPDQQQVTGVPPGNPVSTAQEANPDGADAETAEENTDENADQTASETEQQPNAPDQPGVKTPQEMLQEMQQRQLMLQQQQPPGQPPVPGAGVQQRPPQEQ